MFWRRRRDEAPADEGESAPTDDAPPEIDLDALEPDPSEFDLDEVEIGSPASASDDRSTTPTAEPASSGPSSALDHGLARTRGGFMSRLRGLLVGEGTDGPS